MPTKLFVKVVQARELKSADSNGFSDPYCIVKKGDAKKKTTIVKKNLNPIWNEQFDFDGASGTLEVTVMDWDRIGSHDFLGDFKIDLSSVEEGKINEQWHTLQGPPKEKITGEVHVILYWTSKGDTPVLQPQLVAEGSGQLFVTLLSGKGLAAKDKSGTSDPYAKICFNGQTYKTKTIMKTLDPEWDDAEYYFEVPKEAKSGSLQVLLWDWDFIGSDDAMGQVTIALPSLPDGKETVQNYDVEPQKKEEVSGSIKLRVSFVSSASRQRFLKVAREHYEPLCRVLQAQDVVVVATLCHVYQSNEVAQLVVSMFESNHQAHRVINQLLFREIKATEQETTLFRTDSMATKATRCYMRLLATDYLSDTLGPHIQEVLKSPGGYEVDPNKIQGGEDVNTNMKQLEARCQAVFDSFVSSIDKVPAPVRQLLGSVKMMVGRKFPNAATKAVGGFFFLRFSCPAIFTPEGFDLLSAPPEKNARRALILVSKVLQNLANGVLFGKKEAFMEPMNAFIERNMARVTDFLNTLAVEPKSQMTPSSRELTDEQKLQEMAALVRHLDNNFDKIKAKAYNDVRVVGNATRKAELDEQLATLATALGK